MLFTRHVEGSEGLAMLILHSASGVSEYLKELFQPGKLPFILNSAAATCSYMQKTDFF
jgi:hypothetical protein